MVYLNENRAKIQVLCLYSRVDHGDNVYNSFREEVTIGCNSSHEQIH